jgi:hypothetical protein
LPISTLEIFGHDKSSISVIIEICGFLRFNSFNKKAFEELGSKS